MNDFDKVINRVGSGAIKWEHRQEIFGNADVIPLWVADMDFSSPKEVLNSMEKRIHQGIFGYTDVHDDLYSSIINWNKKRHQWTITKEHLIFSNSVLSSLNVLLRLLTKEKDSILMLTPIYYPFSNICKTLKRIPIYSEMKIDNYHYQIDYDDLEKQIIEQNPKVMIFCNPHNPGGRVWEKVELTRVIALCEKYHLPIISDDIHKDIIFPHSTYTPMVTLSETYKEHIYTLTSPTKIFNIAGIQSAYVVFYNKRMKTLYELETKRMNYTPLNIFAIEATKAAYENCEYWVEDLVQYLYKSYQMIQEGLKSTRFNCFKNEGTYLLWIDYSAFKLSSDEMKALLISHGLGLQMGEQFGEAGYHYFRFNIGTQYSVLETVVEKLKAIDSQVK